MEKLSQEQCYVIGAQVAHDIINGIEKEAAWKDHLPFTDKSPEYYDDDIEYIKGLLATKDENGHVDSNYTWTDEKLLAAAAATSAGLGFAGAATGNPIIGAAGIGAGIGGLAGYAGNKVQRYHLNRHPGSIKGYLRDLKQKQSEAEKRVAMEKEAAWKDYLPFTDKSPEYYDDNIEFIEGMLDTQDEYGNLDSNYKWTDEKLLAAAAATSAGLGVTGAVTANPLFGAAGLGAGLGGLAGYAGNKVQRHALNKHPEAIKGILKDLKRKRANAEKRVAMEKEAGWKDVAAGVAMTGAGLASTGAKAGFTDDAAKYLSGARESISRSYEKAAPHIDRMYDEASKGAGKIYDDVAPKIDKMYDKASKGAGKMYDDAKALAKQEMHNAPANYETVKGSALRSYDEASNSLQGIALRRKYNEIAGKTRQELYNAPANLDIAGTAISDAASVVGSKVKQVAADAYEAAPAAYANAKEGISNAARRTGDAIADANAQYIHGVQGRTLPTYKSPAALHNSNQAEQATREAFDTMLKGPEKPGWMGQRADDFQAFFAKDQSAQPVFKDVQAKIRAGKDGVVDQENFAKFVEAAGEQGHQLGVRPTAKQMRANRVDPELNKLIRAKLYGL